MHVHVASPYLGAGFGQYKAVTSYGLFGISKASFEVRLSGSGVIEAVEAMEAIKMCFKLDSVTSEVGHSLSQKKYSVMK